MKFDLTRVVPEARQIVEVAANVYTKYTEEWFIGLLIHGSALEDGFIAGCSDIDMQLYLEERAFSEHGELPLELCMAVQRELALIDPRPFQYVQSYVLSQSRRIGKIGPIPGAYAMLAGRLPIPEATNGQLLMAAREDLEALPMMLPEIPKALLEHGSGKLERQVRLTCCSVWPVLYQVLTLQQGNVMRIWGLPKPRAIEMLPPDTGVGQAIRAFYEAVRAYYPAEQSTEEALRVIATGVFFLQAAKGWWRECEG